MPINLLLDNAELDLSRAQILVVDDKPVHIQTIYNLLSDDYEILATTSGEDAIDLCYDTPPDLILLDVIMPGLSGLETCRILKQNEGTRRIPIIFLTSVMEQEDETACWENGGIDFITKPVNPITLKNRVKAHLTLKYQTDILANMAYIDGLTGIYNRRYFDEHLIKEIEHINRTHTDSALLIMDIDHFKQYNDTYGHIAGDKALKIVANILKSALKRPTDFVARYGGEEFVILLPETYLDGAFYVAKRIQENIKLANIEHIKSKEKVLSLSIGISTIAQSNKAEMNIIKHADSFLYQSKIAGRNRISMPEMVAI
ncbi:diguanylate cyclase [Catenovulum maritimum]|uniref:diguanylate cyclase n=1 Tax=Catenovulum maritimum TaxID=1513271 RepID=A0A0J8GR14_9ALTE|nr:diguanylate cyclase [Catenovulum maritimum]KMT65270.1 response regulator [Catenovulum maritimum]